MPHEITTRDLEIDHLEKSSKALSKELSILANSLNTAPVTLAALSRECTAVNSLLGRIRIFHQQYSEALGPDSKTIDDICNGPLRELAHCISDLRLYSARLLKRNDGETENQLIIIWNEPALKQTTKDLSASRSSTEFLMNCAISQYDHAEALQSPVSATFTLVDIQEKARESLSPRSPVTPVTPSSVFRVTDLPGVRSALEELKPQPGLLYHTDAKATAQLHSAIHNGEEASVLELLLRRISPNAPRAGSTLTPLQRAFEQKSSSIATYLAVAGASLDDAMGNGETALIRGVRCGFPDKFVALLCELGACINATDNAGSSALHYAATSRTEDDTIAILLHAGADINIRDRSGRTPLILAVEKMKIRPVEVLTEYKADLEARLPNGSTALHVAIAKRHYMLAEVLADRGARLDSPLKDHTALTLAISTGSTEIATMLIESGADIDLQTTSGISPLLAAAVIGDCEVTELLLSHGARLDLANDAGYCPIHMAAHKNRVDVLRLLIRAGSPVDARTKQGETALTIAVHFAYADVLQHLVQAGVDLETTAPAQDRAIFAALRSRNTDLCLRLVQGGADVMSPRDESNNMTPIHMAAELGLDEVVAAIARAGAELETTTWQGYTPLYSAAENGRLSTFRLLLKCGASIRTRSSSGGNLLFVSTATPEILKQLVNLNMDVNERDLYGATPLHYACLRGHAAGAKLLLQKGAHLKHANSVFETSADFKEGTPYRQGTPAGLARQKGHMQLARVIEKWKIRS